MQDRWTKSGAPILVWDAATGAVVRRCEYQHLMMAAVAWSPDSKRLAFVDADGMVTVRDRETGAGIWSASSGGFLPNASRLAWSPDGRRLANAGLHHVHVLNAANGQPEIVLDCGTARIVDEVCWSPDGRYLSAAGLLWETNGWKPQRPLSQERTHRVSWSPDSKFVIVASMRGWIEQVEVPTGRRGVAQPAHAGPAVIAWSPDGRRFATAGLDALVKVWDPVALQPLVALPVDQPITALDWNPDGRSLAVGDGAGTMQILRADESMPAPDRPAREIAGG